MSIKNTDTWLKSPVSTVVFLMPHMWLLRQFKRQDLSSKELMSVSFSLDTKTIRPEK